MALWEYKVISSGKGGFATPALLESFLNQLGVEEWEIIEFRTQPDNSLAFQGLARRPTQREWTLEAAASAAAKAEADKLRAEFAAKFQAATGNGSSVETAGTAAVDPNEPNRDDSFRKPRDTDSDQDPDAIDDTTTEEVDEWPEEEQLPCFFEAIHPHMRRNQKGPGYSVGVDYLVKKFDMVESDLLAALKECGFVIPEDEDDKPVYIDYDGDLYWLNTNRRGELWINTREKPRPVFHTVKGTPVAPEQIEEKNDQNDRRQGRGRRDQQPQQQPAHAPFAANAAHEGSAAVSAETARAETAPAHEPVAQKTESAPVFKPSAEPQTPSSPLPTGLELLEKLRPMMRRSRGGLSGTISFLSRALRQSDAALVDALAASGLQPAATQGEKAPVVEFGDFAYWLNRDGRGGIWINARETRRMHNEARPAPAEQAAPPAQTTPVIVSITPLSPDASEPSPAAHTVAVAAAISSLEPGELVSDKQEAPAAAEKTQQTESLPVAAPAAPAPSVPAEAAAAPASAEKSKGPLAGARLLLKEVKPGIFAKEIRSLAQQLDKNPDELVDALCSIGLRLPEKAREKPVFVEHAGEVFWFNRNAKGQVWLNAKEAKYPAKKSRESGQGEASKPKQAAKKKSSRRS
jgi:hypothetical protein